MGISACMIGRNEENNIKNCIESFQSVVDEIIFVDTGSTDHTLKHLQDYPVKITQAQWDNDFSKARNISLKEASEEWIFVIDCDEILCHESAKLLRSLSETQENIEGFGVVVTSMVGNKESFSSSQLRLFRNDENYFYEGRIHEQIGPSILKMKPNAIFLQTEVTLIHYGYEQIQNLEKEKTKRNLSILSSYSEDEKDQMFYYYLGNEYERMGNLKDSLNNYQIAFNMSQASDVIYSFIAHKLIENYIKLHLYEKAYVLTESLLDEMPDFKALHFLQFTAAFHLQLYEKAYKSLLQFEKIDHQMHRYPYVHYEKNNDIQEIKQLLKIQLGI